MNVIVLEKLDSYHHHQYHTQHLKTFVNQKQFFVGEATQMLALIFYRI